MSLILTFNRYQVPDLLLFSASVNSFRLVSPKCYINYAYTEASLCKVMPPLQRQGQRVMDTIIRVIADTYFVFWYFRHYYLAKSIPLINTLKLFIISRTKGRYVFVSDKLLLSKYLFRNNTFR